MELLQAIELVKDVVNIPIIVNRDNNTYFHSDIKNLKNPIFYDEYIHINKYQIDVELTEELEKREFSKEYRYLQVLLHEVCHYKQLHKHGLSYISKPLNNIDCSHLGISSQEVKENKTYFTRETIADRYALRYYKRFIKEVK